MLDQHRFYLQVLLIYFFFSSRRRHTRYIGDWSSDVCSSDLSIAPSTRASYRPAASLFVTSMLSPTMVLFLLSWLSCRQAHGRSMPPLALPESCLPRWGAAREIGRASCRERVRNAGVAVLREE